METQTDYFKKNTYQAKYNIGDRVRGIWQGVPFAGSVAIDTMINTDDGPHVMVFLDLPIVLDHVTNNIIKVNHDDLLDGKGKYELNRKTNSKT